MLLAWILFTIGSIFVIAGLGFTLRFFAYMVRGVTMSWGVMAALILLGALGATIGTFMIVANLFNLNLI